MEAPIENHDYKIRALKLKIEELYENIYQIKSEKNRQYVLVVADKRHPYLG